MSDEDKQRFLFLGYLNATELLENKNELNQSTEYYPFLRYLLKRFNEELFFSGATSLPMLSPDNKRSMLTKEKLKEFIDKFAE
jgi:hypothetical protein